MEAYLSEFTRYGAYVQNMMKFQEDVITQGISLSNSRLNTSNTEDSGTTHWVCQTYQAFVGAVANFLKSLREHLKDIEKIVIKQGICSLIFIAFKGIICGMLLRL